MDKVRYAIIGFGGIAENRVAREGFACDASRFSPLRGAVLVGATDMNQGRRGAAEALGLRWYGGMEEIFSDSSIDAVYVATNNASHAAIALAALSAGKHVIVEKPIATSVSDAEKMNRLAVKKGLSLTVDHMMVNNAWNIRARNIVSSGRLGVVNDSCFHMEFAYGYDPAEASTWRCSRVEEMGGPIGDVASHCFYVSEFVFGKQKQTAFQELQHAFDLQLVSDFVVYENRSFVQVTFDGQRYLDQVPEPTEEKIAAAYEAKKADFDGKTLDDVRETLAAELKAAAARNRADEAAVKFASDLADAWWKAVEKDADANPAELTAKMGEAIPQAHVSTVEKMDVLQQNSSNSELAGALFSLTMTTPISSAILGQDASYVICLTGIEKQHLADPATDPASYQTLAHVYRESVEMAAAKTRAEAETKRVADALAANEGDFAAAAADLQFTDLPSFSVSDIYNQSAVVNSVRQSKQLQLDALAEELPKVKAPGVFLAPHKAQQVFSLGSNMQSMVIPVGYQILYVANRTVPEKSETNAAERERLHDGLLAMKQSAELKNFYQMLLEQSDTELVPNTPFTASMPEEEEE